jgi:3-isopropylmalate/(R)-2-methylmalate dehydratase small subunit
VTVDMERLLIAAPAAGIEAPFPLDAFTQHRLLEGLDDIGLTLRHVDDIAAYERRRSPWLPALTA